MARCLRPRLEYPPASAPASTVPNVVVQGPPGIERFSVPVTCKSGKHSVAASLDDSSGFRLPPLSNGSSDESPPSCISVPAVQEDINANAEENDSDEDEDTDSDDEDDHGWVTCRGRHYIPRYAYAADSVGHTFYVPRAYMKKAFFANKCRVGKLHSIVRKRGADENDVYFKIYNHAEYPKEPPPENSNGLLFRSMHPVYEFQSRSKNDGVG